MSVNYSLQAATANGWSVLRVLLLWKGSLWKLVWREMLMWLIVFGFSNALYFFVIMNSEMDSSYKYALRLFNAVPSDGTLMFLLTFMTFNSLTRWSDTYKLLVWPENAALQFQQHFNEYSVTPQEARYIRESIVRYLTTTYILIFRDVSTEVREWFPSLEHLVEAKILTNDEIKLLQSSRLAESACHYWIPIDWIALIVKKKYRPKYIVDHHGRKVKNVRASIMTDVGFAEFMNELCRLRGKVGDILSYDWVPLPLAFVQTITVFVYSTLLLNSVKMQGRWVLSDEESLLTQVFVESISTLPFNILYLSFLRISQVVINPFGQDDDDFETPYLIQRHFNVLREILCRDPEDKVSAPKSKDNNEATRLKHTLASALLQRADAKNGKKSSNGKMFVDTGIVT